MREKRGIGHVELVLSFVIFITALVFALFFFSPTNTDKLVETSMIYSFREIEQNTSTKLITFSVKINNAIIKQDEDGVPPKEISLIAINIPDISSEMNTSIKTIKGVQLSSSRAPGEEDKILVKSGLPDRWRNIEFITIEFNEEFVEGEEIENVEVKDTYYSRSSSTEKEILSEKKFRELARYYNENYYGLKEGFNLPSRVNFGFVLEFSDEDKIIAERTVPENLDVYTEVKREEILRENGEIGFANLKINLW